MIKDFLNKIFNKQQELKAAEEEKPEKKEPFQFEKTYAELLECYKCSVQRTPKDFVIKEFKVNGETVTVGMDAACESDGLQKLINETYQMQIAGQEEIYSYFAKQGFIGFNNCSILAQDWLIMKAITAPSEDAIAIEYDLTCDEKEITEEETDIMSKIKKKSNAVTGFDIKEVCKTFSNKKRTFGQALCIPLIDGVDYTKPFNIDAVGYKSYKGMITVEPVWVTNVLSIDGTTNPLSKRFYKPEWFRLPNGQLIHYTWAVFGEYGTIADILKPTYYWGGIPLPQLLYEQVYAAHKTAKEAPMLAMSKRLNYTDGNMNALLFNQEARDGIKALSWFRNNWGWVIKKPEQQIGQLDTTLTDFDSVVMLSYQIVAAISGVIATRLLETSPKGWQSSGSYEDKQYKKLLQNIQKDDFTPILNLHYKLLAKSHYNLDKDYQVCFEEIDVPTAKEAAEIREINARTDSTYINAGVVSAEEIRTTLREDVNSGYNALEKEIPESEDFEFGGSSNEQSPFSEDEEPQEWFTSNGAHIPIENGESKQKAINQRREEEQTQKENEHDLKYSYKAQFLKMIDLDMDEAEFMDVVSGINTIYEANKHKKKIKYHTMAFVYKIENHGFNNYLFSDKIPNTGNRKDWN